MLIMLENFEKIVLKKLKSIENQLPMSFTNFKAMLPEHDEESIKRACYELHKKRYINCITLDDVDNASEGEIVQINYVC